MVFPKLADWKTWAPLERISYVAQLSTALTLLVTVVFAWLGWREARLARVDQTRFFVASNAPEIELAKVLFEKPGILTLTMRNTGGSPATNVSVAVLLVGQTKPLRDTNGDDIFGQLGIPKGGEAILPLMRSVEFAPALGGEPKTVIAYEPGNSVAGTAFVVIVRFKGQFGDGYSRMKTFVMSR